MLTLYHSPHSRSTRVIALLHAMEAMDRVDIRPVTIPRQDGTGGRDPANPHPEGKVPYLLADGARVWETTAIVLYLTDRFGGAMGIAPDDPRRGTFLAWLAWYAAVLEPALILDAAGVSHPWMTAAIRGRAEALHRLEAALDGQPWIMGERYTAADLMLASPFLWFDDPLPDHPVLRDWAARCRAQPCLKAALDYDTALAAQQAA
jgi:glutathione S-transferase